MTYRTATFKRPGEKRRFFLWSGDAGSRAEAADAATADLVAAWTCLNFGSSQDHELPADLFDRKPAVREIPKFTTSTRSATPHWIFGREVMRTFQPPSPASPAATEAASRAKATLAALTRHAAHRLGTAVFYLESNVGPVDIFDEGQGIRASLDMIGYDTPAMRDPRVVQVEPIVASAMLAMSAIRIGAEGKRSNTLKSPLVQRPSSATLRATYHATDPIWTNDEAMGFLRDVGIAAVADRLSALRPKAEAFRSEIPSSGGLTGGVP